MPTVRPNIEKPSLVFDHNGGIRLPSMRPGTRVHRAIVVAASICFLSALAACSNPFGSSDLSSSSVAELPERLALEPNGGVFTELSDDHLTIRIEPINTEYEPEAIYYTLDNTTPTSDSEEYPDGGISVSETSFVRAKAVFPESSGEPDAYTAGLFVVADVLTEPDDDLYKQDDGQWHYRNIQMPKAWTILADTRLHDGGPAGADLTPQDDPIRVAVLDTGYHAHEDLCENITHCNDDDGDGYNFFDTDDHSDPSLNSDDDPHGTHVSGTIASVTNNGAGVAGVGWDGKGETAGGSHIAVLPVRVLDDDGNGSTESITEGVLYAAGLETDADVSTPTPAAAVINLSLGGVGTAHDSILYTAIQQAVDAGVTVIAAVGNDNGGSVRFPANFDNTIAVSATTSHNDLAEYSNLGPEVDFAAPGGTESKLVWSTWSDTQYAGSAGTSMAAPHVSGVVGLLYAYQPELRQAEVYEILKRSAKLVDGAEGHTEEYGWGLIDAEAALRTLLTHHETEGWGTGTSSAALTTQSGGSGSTESREIDWENAEYEANTLLVRFREDRETGPTAQRRRERRASELARVHNLESLRMRGKLGVARVPSERALPEVARQLADDPTVEHVQPNYIYRAIR